MRMWLNVELHVCATPARFGVADTTLLLSRSPNMTIPRPSSVNFPATSPTDIRSGMKYKASLYRVVLYCNVPSIL